MKNNYILLLLTLLLSSLVFTGCISSSEGQMRSLNKNRKASNSPTRFTKTVSNDKYDTYGETWAGTPGQSVTTGAKQLRSDIFNMLEKNCGLKASQLVQTRIVSQKSPEFKEVWVFKDPLSKRKDGLSGLSITLKQLPNNNGVDFVINGECHASAPMTFTFGK